MNTYDLIEDINMKVERHINKNMTQVYCGRENTGLDSRCGLIYINEECIAVDKRNDRTLQYYGGFEYVDKEFRKEMGDYVFYFNEDARVSEHIDRYYDREEDEVSN